MVSLNRFNNSAYSILSYFLSRALNNVNYVKCRCGFCVNCHEHDGPDYHNRFHIDVEQKRSCVRARTCVHCQKVKNNQQDYYGRYQWICHEHQETDLSTYIKHGLIDVYVFFFSMMMIPFNILCALFYITHNMAQSTLDMLYQPVILTNQFGESFSYNKCDDIVYRYQVDHYELLNLDIFSKILYMIRFCFLSTYATLIYNMDKSRISVDRMVCFIGLIGFGLVYGLMTHTISIFMLVLCVMLVVVTIYDHMLVVHGIEGFSLTLIHLPRIVLTLCVCVSAHIAIMIDYFTEMILINKCAYPFLKIDNELLPKDNYYDYNRAYDNSNDFILTKDIDVCHIFFRIFFIIPTFIYYLSKCMINTSIISIFGKTSKGTHTCGDLFEIERLIFYRDIRKGTILYQLFKNINNIGSMVIEMIFDNIELCVKILTDIFIRTPWSICVRCFNRVMRVIIHYFLIQYIIITNYFKVYLLNGLYRMRITNTYYYFEQIDTIKQKQH